MVPIGDAFRAALHRDDLEIAAEERSEGDWPDARYFLRRAEAVPTADNVDEPLDRRVEIFLR